MDDNASKDELWKAVAERDARIAVLDAENYRQACALAICAENECGAKDLESRVAELEKALRQAIEWNWMQDDVPMEVIEQVAAALGVPATEL